MSKKTVAQKFNTEFPGNSISSGNQNYLLFRISQCAPTNRHYFYLLLEILTAKSVHENTLLF